MTLFETIKSNPTLVHIPEDTINAAFIRRDIDHSEDFTSANVKQLELVTADLYMAIAASPEIREGELSVKWDKGVLMGQARGIYAKYEDDRLEEAGWRKMNPSITKL
jgi:hypothetical protein